MVQTFCASHCLSQPMAVHVVIELIFFPSFFFQYYLIESGIKLKLVFVVYQTLYVLDAFISLLNLFKNMIY